MATIATARVILEHYSRSDVAGETVQERWRVLLEDGDGVELAATDWQPTAVQAADAGRDLARKLREAMEQQAAIRAGKPGALVTDAILDALEMEIYGALRSATNTAQRSALQSANFGLIHARKALAARRNSANNADVQVLWKNAEGWYIDALDWLDTYAKISKES